MKVRHRLVPRRRLAYVWLSPSANFRDMVQHFQALVRRQPEVIGYDYVCDLTDFSGDAFCADVDEIAAEYLSHPQPLRQTLTCFVTSDEGFPLWTSAMDEMFAGRRHVVFTTLADAAAFLDSTRADPSCSLSSPPPQDYALMRR